MPDADLAVALERAREVFLEYLRNADEDGAVAVVTELLGRAVPPTDVLVDVVAAAQRQVGELWQANLWNVAQEHAATHISDRAVTAVAMAATRAAPAATHLAATHLAATDLATPRPAATYPAATRGRVVVACLDGEFHALPARIVAEALRLAGWQVTFLGASVPAPHLTSYLHEHGPDAVALSCALALRLPAAHTVIQTCRRLGIPVVVGGRGFGVDGRWAYALGAEYWAPHARAAATCLDAAVAAPAGGTEPDPLEHLADDEYRLVAKRRPELVVAALAALRTAFPPMRSYTDEQLRHTVDDLGYIVDFLAAALYVDDAELFADFVGWLADILAARSVPLASVDGALRTYRGLLYDFPRATRMLDAGGSRMASLVDAGEARAER